MPSILNKCFFFTLFMSQTVGLCISKNLTCTLDYSGSLIIKDNYLCKVTPRMKILITMSHNFALSQEISNHNQLNFIVCDFKGNNCSDPKSLV